MFDGIIFDLDGVLWDSSSHHERAFLDVLTNYGVHHFNYSDFAGMKTIEVFKSVFEGSNVVVSEHELAIAVKAKQDLAFEKIKRNPPIQEGVNELLLELSEGYKLGLASSSSRRNVELFLSGSNHSFFSSVLSGEDVINGKPDPSIYKLSCERLGLKPEKTLVFEDAVTGAIAGLEAGCHVCGIVNNEKDRERLRNVGLSLFIPTILDSKKVIYG